MEFTKVGKTYQLVIKNGQDLNSILTLDEALWGATSAPASLFNCDSKLITILDPNKTGRVCSNSLKDAISWFLAQIKDPESITEEFSGSLKLNELKSDAEVIINSAKDMLVALGAPDDAISLKQIRDYLASVAKLPFNGDGVISMLAAKANPDLETIVADTIVATGGTQDADGTMGATEQNIKDFLAAAKDYIAWYEQGLIPAGQTKTDIMPMGADTPALSGLVNAIEPQVEQFFKLSGLLGFDERLEAKALAPDAKVAAFDPANLPEVDAYLANMPMARPNKSSQLPLDLNAINPAYRTPWNNVINKVLKPVLGNDITAITPEQWASVKALFAPYVAYMAGKKGAIVEKIDIAQLKKHLANDKIEGAIIKTATEDKHVAEVLKAAREVEKLLLYRTYLIRLANNFVSFPELYDAKKRALFECGRLVIDGRWFNLAFQVDNVAAHQACAKNGLLCVLYVAVAKPTGPVNIVVPVTYGTKGNLAVGKRGVFFDFDGKEYDATVTALIENPVCVKEALLAPFYKMWSMVEGKIEGWSGNAEKSMTSKFDKALDDTKDLGKAKEQPPKPATDKNGMLLGASVAVAALGSAFAFISQTLSKMSGTAIWITIVCALIALLAPISIMAIIKLRKQDLSSLLEGCGWAINLHMKLTSRLRGQFTNYGKYPTDAKGTPRSTFIPKLICAIVIIAGIGIGLNFAYRAFNNMQIQLQEAQLKEHNAIIDKLNATRERKLAEAAKAAEELKAAEESKDPKALTLKAKAEQLAKEAAEVEAELSKVQEEKTATEKQLAELKATIEVQDADKKAEKEAKEAEKAAETAK